MKRRTLSLIASVFSLLCITHISSAQTTVNSNITSDTTWSKANSPYIVTSSITINSGVTLTIEPGVDVLMDSTVQIFVNGILSAVGNISDSISFSPNSSGAGRLFWAGIAADFGKVTLRYVNVKNAATGIVTGQNSEIRYCRIESCFKGVSAKYKGLSIVDNLFIYNRTGLDIVGSGDFNNNLFSSNTMWGVYGSSLDSIYDCWFEYNNVGITGSAYLKYCILVNNSIAAEGPQLNLSCNQITMNNTGIRNVLYVDSTNKICSNQYNAVYTLTGNHSLPRVCWCETDSASIASKILDGNDISAYGKLLFMPVKNCDPNTTVMSLCNGSPTTVKEIPSHHFVLIPNPAYSSFTLFSEQSLDGKEVRIINILGETVYFLKHPVGDQITIDRAGLAQGIYLVQIVSNGMPVQTERLLLLD